MLDAVPPALIEPSAPVQVIQVTKPNPEQAQQFTAPVQQVISPPEAIPPKFLAQPVVDAVSPAVESTPPTTATQPPSSQPALSSPTEPSSKPVDSSKPVTLEPAKEHRLKLLEQKLAEIVAREKPIKEEKLRQNLKASAINAAKAGQLSEARQAAQDMLLSPETQAELLAEIKAIEDRERTQLAGQPSPKQPQPSVNANRNPATSKPKTASVPYSALPPSYSVSNFGVNPGGTSASGREFRNWNLSGLANNLASRMQPGNGNLSLVFPLPIPVEITSGFGWRTHPIRGDRRFHKGVDLGAPIGTPVVAAYAGKVALADWLDGYGLTTILSHNKATQETLYAHLSEVFVKPGDWVEQGAVIGRVGNTGMSTGPHLHFELRQLTSTGWETIDPGVQIETALAQLMKFLQTGQQITPIANQLGKQLTSQVTVPFEIYASVPPPPTEKRSITHNF